MITSCLAIIATAYAVDGDVIATDRDVGVSPVKSNDLCILHDALLVHRIDLVSVEVKEAIVSVEAKNQALSFGPTNAAKPARPMFDLFLEILKEADRHNVRRRC